VFDLSASDNLVIPSLRIPLSMFSENETETTIIHLRPSDVKDEFDSSASDNLITPSSPMSLTELSENEMNQQLGYSQNRVM
jgi:hypothetical protein